MNFLNGDLDWVSSFACSHFQRLLLIVILKNFYILKVESRSELSCEFS